MSEQPVKRYRSYRDSVAYKRSEKPELRPDGSRTGRNIFPLPFLDRR